MIAPLLALQLLAGAAPCAASAPVAVAPAASAFASSRPDSPESLTVVFMPPEPGSIDGPACRPRTMEYVFPAGSMRIFTARSETTFAVPPGLVFELSNLVGDIAVEGWRRNVVRIVADHGRRDRMQARMENGTLSVGTTNRQGIPRPVDYSINVPQWMPLRLSGVETDISVRDVNAPITAESVRGNVSVRGGVGLVQLSSVEGEVNVQDSRGELQATSINNIVQIVRAIGVVDVESVNGDIRLGQIDSPDVQASSMNGSVLFSGPFHPRGRYRLASHRGKLLVGVPENAGVDVSIASFNGTFQSGFPLQLGPWHKGHKFGFTLGSGGSSLELESYQGLIQLLRPGALPPLPPMAPPPPSAPRASRAPLPPASQQAPQPEDK